MSKLDQASSHPSGRWRGRFRGTLKACGMAFASLPRAALDIALPTLCVSCHEPVAGDGVCAACWGKLSFIAPPFCARLGIPSSTIRDPVCCRCKPSPTRRPISAPALPL
jgi:hypothetical protein